MFGKNQMGAGHGLPLRVMNEIASHELISFNSLTLHYEIGHFRDVQRFAVRGDDDQCREAEDAELSRQRFVGAHQDLIVGDRIVLLRPLADFFEARATDLDPQYDHAPFALFALGRTAGWIAHALEQYERDRLIRPRARYTAAS